MRLLFASAILALAGCNDAPSAPEAAAPDAIYGRWTPVTVNDCDAVVVTLGDGVFGANVSGAPQPFSIGETVRVERPEPGFVDVVYHPTTYDPDGRPVGAVIYTETVRFEVVDPDHLRGVGHFPRDATRMGPLPAESAHVLDIQRCPTVSDQSPAGARPAAPRP